MGRLVKLLVAIGLLSGGVIALFKGLMELEEPLDKSEDGNDIDVDENTVSYEIEQIPEEEEDK